MENFHETFTYEELSSNQFVLKYMDFPIDEYNEKSERAPVIRKSLKELHDFAKHIDKENLSVGDEKAFYSKGDPKMYIENEDPVKEILNCISVLEQKTNGFDTLGHLWDEDPEVSGAAELRKMVRNLKFYAELITFKELRFPDQKAYEPSRDTGAWVAVRSCCEEDGDETYLGIHLGDIATSSSVNVDEKSVQLNFSRHNPAMYVPELKKVIFGQGSWWKRISSPEDLSEISNQDINNVWYVKALKEIVNERST